MIISFEWKPGLSIICRDQDHYMAVVTAYNKLGFEAFCLLMQARGWACRWLNEPEKNPSAEKLSSASTFEFSFITLEFIRNVDRILGLADSLGGQGNCTAA